MEKIKAVVFDLDGTLVDSLADIAAATNAALVAHGRRPHPLSAYSAMVGWGLRRLLATATADQPLSEAEGEVAYQDLVAAYRAHPVDQTRPYDGISLLLQTLSGSLPLAVLSNKDDGMVKTIVTTLFPEVSWAALVGSRAGQPNKPDPTSLQTLIAAWSLRPEQVAFLGDSAVDIETARRAGAVACGATWGFRDRAELSAAGAHALFTHPEAFGTWVRNASNT